MRACVCVCVSEREREREREREGENEKAQDFPSIMSQVSVMLFTGPFKIHGKAWPGKKESQLSKCQRNVIFLCRTINRDPPKFLPNQWSSIAQWLAFLLTVPATPGLIPSVPQKNSEKKLSMLQRLINGTGRRKVESRLKM